MQGCRVAWQHVFELGAQIQGRRLPEQQLARSKPLFAGNPQKAVPNFGMKGSEKVHRCPGATAVAECALHEYQPRPGGTMEPIDELVRKLVSASWRERDDIKAELQVDKDYLDAYAKMQQDFMDKRRSTAEDGKKRYSAERMVRNKMRAKRRCRGQTLCYSGDLLS